MAKKDRKSSYKHDSSDQTDSDNSLGSLDKQSKPKEKLTTSETERKKKQTHVTSSASTSSPINDDAQPMAKSAVQRAVKKTINPGLRIIDTMEMDAPLNAQQIESAIKKLKAMRSEKRARQLTSESKFWKAKFTVPLGSGSGGRNVSVTFYFECTANNSNVPMRLQFNVSLIREEHARRFIKVFKEVFPFDYKQVAKSLRFHGVDEAYDRPGSLEDFVLERPASTTVERYYIRTNSRGEIQTSYIGSEDSPSHGVLYDLGGADAFRNALGEAVPLNKDTATHKFNSREGMIRIESRRVFKGSPLTLKELLELPSAFHEYQFLDLNRLSAKDRCDPAFIGYVDSVRLRGVHAASKRLEAALGGGRPAKRQVALFEARLGTASCVWWSAIDHRQKLGVLLRKSAIWKFLRHTATAD